MFKTSPVVVPEQAVQYNTHFDYLRKKFLIHGMNDKELVTVYSLQLAQEANFSQKCAFCCM